MTEREDCVYRAKLAEQVERYDEMVEAMKKVVQLGGPLNTEERNLLSVAYKNVIGARRSSWRIISTIEQREDSKGNSDKTELVRRFRRQFEDELKSVSGEILGLIENHLIGSSEDADASGDYYRYMAEFSVESERESVAKESLDAYKAASEVAQASLKPTNPIRLGLALNFSVFYYEIKNKPDEACKLAKQAFDEAIAELDSLPEDSYKDSTLIMQLLRDNLTLWTSDLDTEEDRKGPDEEKA